jgi:hypothetical protein
MSTLNPTSDVLIHVRFYPNGEVQEISERPSWATPQQWFKQLAKKGLYSFEIFTGGRGLFRVPVTELSTLKADQQ